MSKSKSKTRKKVVVTTGGSERKAPRSSPRSRPASRAPEVEMIFKKPFFIWVGIGLALIAVGFVLMGGGAMPSPDVWDESLIYSPRRTVVAPLFILAGLAVEVYAVLKK